MKPKVKSNKWYGWFWPPERRKVKIMQIILDSKMPEIQPLIEKGIRDELIYGIPFGISENDEKSWRADDEK